jgi:hypothetical protein
MLYRRLVKAHGCSMRVSWNLGTRSLVNPWMTSCIARAEPGHRHRLAVNTFPRGFPLPMRSVRVGMFTAMTQFPLYRRLTPRMDLLHPALAPKTEKWAVLGVLLFLVPSPGLFAQGSVLTWHNDNARTGQNLQETILTPVNVNSSTFGKQFTISVDGKVDAQPLYVPSLTFPSIGTYNVLFVVTRDQARCARQTRGDENGDA